MHPNHKRPARLKVKYFEFAGKVVGKCLYESAMGNTLLVKARFTRSFLAQLIGLRIHYKVQYVHTCKSTLILYMNTYNYCDNTIMEGDINNVSAVLQIVARLNVKYG